MKPIKLTENVYALPAIDWNLRDFHGYATHLGTTYNAYLVVDEKVVLIDTVKAGFVDDLLEGIREIIDPERIDFVISNHTEMDHSGSLPKVMQCIGERKPVYCSKVGLKNLPRHFREVLNYQAVENGAEMSLGKKTLTFLETRMLHWPDSMFTYLKEERILFSSDAFGQHYAGLERFDDEIGDTIMPHALKYFANILLPYSDLILKLVDTVKKLGLAIDMACPDHGIIWRKNPGKIIHAYAEWSSQKPRKKALVVYDTMWQSTQKMAEAIVSGLGDEGVDARPMHLRTFHRSDIITEIVDAGAIVVGSPTLNNGLFPTVSDFLTYMKGLRPKHKIAAAFGSYGWSGEAVQLITKELEEMKFRVMDAGLKVNYVPDRTALEPCHDLGRKLGKELSTVCT